MLATIKQDGKFGAINLRGEIVVPCKYILEEAMISVPISNKVYRQKQEEVKNAKGNGDFDDLLDKIAECRTNFQTSDVGGVMDGKIDGFIKAYLMEFGGVE